MALVTWDDWMKIGCKPIDDQHKHLIDVINDLNEAVDAGKGAMIYNELFQELADYFTQHFSTEEGLMLDNGFPDYDNHRVLHDSFMTKVKEFRTKSFEGNQAMSKEILNYLINWLVHHDLSMDRELGAFLTQRKVV